MRNFLLSIFFGISVFSTSCSSIPEVKKQNYAQLRQQRTFEYEFPTVWKGIEEVLRKYKVTQREPSEVSSLELKKLTHRSLETDWIYGQSRDKYVEYTVNETPRKIYLQTRFKYKVEATKVIGGVNVFVSTVEEIERLDRAGNPIGYTSANEQDSSRPNELLERIKLALLSAVP